jgi:hypothetical protein
MVGPIEDNTSNPEKMYWYSSSTHAAMIDGGLFLDLTAATSAISARLVGPYYETLSGSGMAGRCKQELVGVSALNLISPGWLLTCLMEMHEMRTNVLVCISCSNGGQEKRGSIPGRFREYLFCLAPRPVLD